MFHGIILFREIFYTSELTFLFHEAATPNGYGIDNNYCFPDDSEYRQLAILVSPRSGRLLEVFLQIKISKKKIFFRRHLWSKI